MIKVSLCEHWKKPGIYLAAFAHESRDGVAIGSTKEKALGRIVQGFPMCFAEGIDALGLDLGMLPEELGADIFARPSDYGIVIDDQTRKKEER